ncbi:TetR-like C-terminal domain-containing protein [Mesorhizobium japonicum]|uniref:TetR-like C-terminal domain-containing protein n=1 Tax=Mesorhizobium japonicum TaxID=2066070 RepID=UPI003B5AB613
MPRAGLSREAVTDLAVQLVDASPDGWAELTLAAVAGRAGVAVPSLYKHIGSLADLRRAIALVGLLELHRRAALATVGRSGDDALRALARALRDFARQHPGLWAATQVAPGADPDDAPLAQAAADVVALVAAVLQGFGLPAERSVDAVRTTRATVHGFIELELHGGFGMPDDVDASFDAALDVLAAGLRVLAAR